MPGEAHKRIKTPSVPATAAAEQALGVKVGTAVGPQDLLAPPAPAAAPGPFPTPSMGRAWIEASGCSEAERRRRILALHQTCTRLLAVPPAQRPRSLNAFANFTRRARQVCSNTISPLDVLQRLDSVPGGLANHPHLQAGGRIPKNLREQPTDAMVRCIQRRWDSHRQTSLGDPVEALMVWVKDASIVRQRYSAEEIAAALCHLKFFQAGSGDAPADFGSDLSSADASRLLPAVQVVPTHSCMWSTFRATGSMPPGCAGAFFGRRGAACQAFAADLQRLANEAWAHQGHTDTEPQVRLSVKEGMVYIALDILQWESSQVLGAASEVDILVRRLQRALATHLMHIYSRRLTTARNRRERHAEIRRAWAGAYHRQRRTAREAKRQEASSVRALQLPPAGISSGRGFVSAVTRKDIARHRRQSALQQKRKDLLQAYCSMSLQNSSRHERTLRDGNGRSSRQAPGQTGRARRLMRHLNACKEETAQQALECLAAVAAAPRGLAGCSSKPRKSGGPRQKARSAAILADAQWDEELW